MEKRPEIYDLNDSDILEIAKQVFEEMSGNFENSDISEDDIYHAIKDIGNSNGFEYAKHLEDSYSAYNIDSIIVDALDSIQWSLYEDKKAKEKQWVSKNNIVPVYKVGDIVSHIHGKNSIAEIDYEYARYKINTDKENTKAIVNFEDVTEVSNV